MSSMQFIEKSGELPSVEENFNKADFSDRLLPLMCSINILIVSLKTHHAVKLMAN